MLEYLIVIGFFFVFAGEIMLVCGYLFGGLYAVICIVCGGLYALIYMLCVRLSIAGSVFFAVIARLLSVPFYAVFPNSRERGESVEAER